MLHVWKQSPWTQKFPSWPCQPSSHVMFGRLLAFGTGRLDFERFTDTVLTLDFFFTSLYILKCHVCIYLHLDGLWVWLHKAVLLYFAQCTNFDRFLRSCCFFRRKLYIVYRAVVCIFCLCCEKALGSSQEKQCFHQWIVLRFSHVFL